MRYTSAAVLFSFAFSMAITARAQHDHHSPETPAKQAATAEELNQATEIMARKAHGDHEHHMGPHMQMSTLRPLRPGDTQKADAVVQAARTLMEKFKDPAAAEADGFRLFLPQLKKQKQYHYTNYRYAWAAAFGFDAAKPTSLLYADDQSGKKRLIGVMYTAPARFSEDQLHERIPLSVAQWHQHVNLCVPPKDKREEMFQPNPKFGLLGSISTEAECKAAGGTFKPRIFGWMVHAYPDEKTPDAIWSVERQKPENMVSATPKTAEHRHR